jgi:hypothetical protein
MSYSRLEIDIGSFIERLFPNKTAEAARMFWTGVDGYVGTLLRNDAPIPFPIATLNEMFHDTATASEFFGLFIHAAAYKAQARLLERKIDVGKILENRLRLVKSKTKVNTYRRRII